THIGKLKKKTNRNLLQNSNLSQVEEESKVANLLQNSNLEQVTKENKLQPAQIQQIIASC
ncbi:MAG: hypothetical protein LRY73_12870, partial [Bacillus sp. (in: Bacteria)]|nr:hypothetical protein [Bacillus sp. (in: firmicutes)]